MMSPARAYPARPLVLIAPIACRSGGPAWRALTRSHQIHRRCSGLGTNFSKRAKDGQNSERQPTAKSWAPIIFIHCWVVKGLGLHSSSRAIRTSALDGLSGSLMSRPLHGSGQYVSPWAEQLLWPVVRLWTFAKLGTAPTFTPGRISPTAPRGAIGRRADQSRGLPRSKKSPGSRRQATDGRHGSRLHRRAMQKGGRVTWKGKSARPPLERCELGRVATPRGHHTHSASSARQHV